MTDADKRYWIRKFLDMRDGHKCSLLDNSCKGPLIIDHREGNRGNWKEDNLRWLCTSHNRRSEIGEREREKLIRDDVDYRQGSTEMQVNERAEPKYRAWLWEWISKVGWITRKEAIYSGAKKFDISPTTTRKYLGKETSAEGSLTELKDPSRGWVVRFRK
jgi:DNA-binding PucR family transcriptional regulator